MYSLKNDQWKFGQTYSFASLFKTDLTNFSPIFFTITSDYTPQRFSAFFFLRNYVYMYIKYMCMCSHTLPPPPHSHTTTCRPTRKSSTCIPPPAFLFSARLSSRPGGSPAYEKLRQKLGRPATRNDTKTRAAGRPGCLAASMHPGVTNFSDKKRWNHPSQGDSTASLRARYSKH